MSCLQLAVVVGSALPQGVVCALPCAELCAFYRDGQRPNAGSESSSLCALQWLQLEWLCAALEPQGLPPLLLNKFLSLAKQRI